MDDEQAMMGHGGGNLTAAMASFHQQYSQNLASAPVGQTANLFHQWAQQQPRQQVNAMAEEALGHLPQHQQQQVADALVNLFQENGLSLRAAGVQTTHPQSMSMGDVAKMVGYVQQSQPNLLQKLLSNRLIRMVILAILAYEANKLMRGYAFSGGEQAPSPGATAPTPAPAQPHESFGDHVRNFLGGLFGGHDEEADTPPSLSEPPSTGSGVTSTIPPETMSGLRNSLRGASDMPDQSGHPHRRSLSDDDPTT